MSFVWQRIVGRRKFKRLRLTSHDLRALEDPLPLFAHRSEALRCISFQAVLLTHENFDYARLERESDRGAKNEAFGNALMHFHGGVVGHEYAVLELHNVLL